MEKEDATVVHDIARPLNNILMQLPVERLKAVKDVLSEGKDDLAIQNVINSINTLIIQKSENADSKEEWREIPGYEGMYEVSNIGRIKSLERKCNSKSGWRIVPECIRRPALDNYGYPIISLYKDGKKKTYTIHRLVAKVFLKNPDNLPEINHIDENKINNCVYNLEWCSNAYNESYGTKAKRAMELQQRVVVQYDMKGNFVKKWNGANEVERITGMSQSAITRCCNGKRNYAYGYLWRYER